MFNRTNRRLQAKIEYRDDRIEQLNKKLDRKNREALQLDRVIVSLEREQTIKIIGEEAWDELNQLRGEVKALRAVLTQTNVERSDVINYVSQPYN